MLVRIRWRGETEWKSWALALGSLLAPLSLLAFTVSFWAFAAELHWTNAFPFTQSPLNYWQFWILIATFLLAAAKLLAHLADANGNIAQ